eukprot:c53451_g1_i1.p1 GENE.c53451_g1_i1~~c53451_g1_i1.p1  ORF type:complete len:210 (+),score=58.89 c53451_g1_i1:47-676(+)
MYLFECVDPAFKLYMGLDKFENEDLIKWGWPEDVWFHVSNLSSAHVYVRMPRGMTMDQLPENVVKDACQLVKANSIEGCKKDFVSVVYTPWHNLKKTPGMDVGQVGFKNDNEVRNARRVEKDNEIVKRLKRTRTEVVPNLPEEKQARDDQEKEIKRQIAIENKRLEKDERDKKKEETERTSYDLLMNRELMQSNHRGNVDVNEFEEGFM